MKGEQNFKFMGILPASFKQLRRKEIPVSSANRNSKSCLIYRLCHLSYFLIKMETLSITDLRMLVFLKESFYFLFLLKPVVIPQNV